MKNKKKFFKRIFNDVKLNKNLPSIDFHIHTNWTDGKNSVKQVYKRSNSVGLDYMLYSEHSRKSSKGWFKRFHREIKSLQIKNCKPFVGTEVKVLNLNGDLDLSFANYKLCDLIMASVHRFPGEKDIKKKNKFSTKNKKNAVNTELKLLLAACKNKKTDIIGHPFGMSIKRFGITPKLSYFEKVIKFAKKNDKVFEINLHYHKKIFKKLIKLCLQHNCLMSFGSNAHSLNEIKNLNKIKL
tara:strand:+ start:245 stop:964 length:720 start_codon:yes stop_codon:yes gene_type:complete